jgi:hypothetical protein
MSTIKARYGRWFTRQLSIDGGFRSVALAGGGLWRVLHARIVRVHERGQKIGHGIARKTSDLGFVRGLSQSTVAFQNGSV